MTSPVYDPLSSTLTSIRVTWSALSTLASQGGVAVDSYHLQWDSGTSGVTWTDVQGQDGSLSTATSATISSGITGGNSYQFRLRAHNIHGWGTYSSVLTVTASGVPAQPAAVTTTLSNQDV